jgi:hypothetical protein
MTPDQMPAVTEDMALGLVRKYLSGLRHYPLHEEGQKCLAMYLAKYALSMRHAISIVEAFHEDCPTPQNLHDVAYNENLRAKFLPPVRSQKEQWEAQGYTLDATWYKQIQNQLQGRKPGEPREIDLMYKAVKQKLKIKDWTHVSWGQIWSTARDLGFPLNTEQKEDAARWEALQPRSETRPIPPARKVANGETGPRRITQEDIDAAKRKRETEPREEKENP